MRDLVPWVTAVLLVLAAVFTVAVRRDLYDIGRDIGVLEESVIERRRLNDNLELARERLASPMAVAAQAERAGVELVPAEAGVR